MTEDTKVPILLVDDEESVLRSLELALISHGVKNVVCMTDSRRVLSFLQDQECAAVVLDLSMPYVSGIDLLTEIQTKFPEVRTLVVTSVDDVETAVKCLQLGAFDYLVKPVETKRFVTSVLRMIEIRELRNENQSLKTRLVDEKLNHPESFDLVVTHDRKMISLFRYVESIAASSFALLIQGETGTGKELMAKAAHTASGRSGPLVSVNVAGLDETAFSDTLFGHRKGAFTGADGHRSGLIHAAAGGTLFLDEIGDLSPSCQIKLLRVLQEKEYYPLGSDVPSRCETRFIFATNVALEQAQKEGRFRKDLYYRIAAHQITIPPLRERRGDIPILVEHFLQKIVPEDSETEVVVDDELWDLWNRYDFPGNVRELESQVAEVYSSSLDGRLSAELLRNRLSSDHFQTADPVPVDPLLGLSISPGNFPTLKDAEDHLILLAMKRTQGNQGGAAKLLGISRQTLNAKLKFLPPVDLEEN